MTARQRGATLLAALLAMPALGGDWPQWGGPLRGGTAPAEGVFSAGPFELRELWRRPVGEGIAALVVAGGRVVSTSAEEGAVAVFALDAATGKELWRFPLGALGPGQEWGPASTPVNDGAAVFVLSPACRLVALDAASGKLRWQHDLPAEFAPKPMATGCWTSPLLSEGRLVVQVNGEPDKRVVAFDRASGEVVWATAATPRAVRTSPGLAAIGGVDQILIHANQNTRGEVTGLAASDGTTLWRFAYGDEESYSYDLALALGEDRVGVVTWNDFRVLRVVREDSQWKAVPQWASPAIRAEVQPFKIHVVPHRDLVFGFANDLLSCLDAGTGQLRWQEKLYPGSLIAVDGHLVVLSQASGLLRVVKATGAAYSEEARKEVFAPGALAETPPSFAGHHLYLRNAEEIVALEVVPKGDRAR